MMLFFPILLVVLMQVLVLVLVVLILVLVLVLILVLAPFSPLVALLPLVIVVGTPLVIISALHRADVDATDKHTDGPDPYELLM